MTQKAKKSTQVALGGLASALCLLLMFMTGIIPFGEYALPACAGIVIIAVVVENGCKTAVLVYAAVSLLAIFMVPMKESALIFIFFFGYYPILQTKLIKIKPKLLQYILKFFIFNVAVIAAYMVIIYVFGLTEILDEFGDFGKYSALILLALGNVFFAIYDFAIDNLHQVYISYFRPKFLRRIG